ncbi:hypothetical protein ACFYWU_37905 [Streptomyces chrestomyceticus]|uniref:hypothetical protein n=1 Tax=Streptomyces chrestomyceticus TaxID=68185 RepID=UPI0036A6A9CA
MPPVAALDVSPCATCGVPNLAVIGAGLGTVFAGPVVGIVTGHGLGVTDTLSESGNRAELSATHFHSGLVGPLPLLSVLDQTTGTRTTALAGLPGPET